MCPYSFSALQYSSLPNIEPDATMGASVKDPDPDTNKGTRLIPSWLSPRRWMAQLDLDLWSLCMLAKGALAPVLVIAMSVTSPSLPLTLGVSTKC